MVEKYLFFELSKNIILHRIPHTYTASIFWPVFSLLDWCHINPWLPAARLVSHQSLVTRCYIGATSTPGSQLLNWHHINLWFPAARLAPHQSGHQLLDWHISGHQLIDWHHIDLWSPANITFMA